MERIERIAQEALKEIAFTHRDGASVMVSLPVRYPSGSLATLEISAGPNEVFISDRGMGFWEAESLCSTSSFDKFANEQARSFGVRYEAQSIFALRVPISATAGALVAVANASCTAAIKSVAFDSERKETEQENQIFEKLKIVFPNKHVMKSAELSGERALWEAHNVVEVADNKYAVFEPIGRHANSISSKFLMLSDLNNNPDLKLNAVFDSLENIGPKALMIGQVANLMTVADTKEQYLASVQ